MIKRCVGGLYLILISATAFPPMPVWIIEKLWFWWNVKRKQNA